MAYTTAQRLDMVKSGEAMPPDGAYPIRTRRDLANAILAVGRATNIAATRRFIIKRARALNAVDMLPASWNVTA